MQLLNFIKIISTCSCFALVAGTNVFAMKRQASELSSESPFKKTKTEQKSFACEHCNKTYSCQKNLKRHAITHMGERPFPCGECEKSFTQRAYLTEHLRIHSGEKPFTCKHCDKRFAAKNNCRAHEKKIHKNKSYKCGFEGCNKNFDSEEKCNNHKKSHERVKCTYESCGKDFADNGNLKKHVLRTHNKDEPFECGICKRTFAFIGDFTTHKKSHEPFKCSFENCKKEYKDKNSFDSHLRIHSGDKPFACEQCDKSFTHKKYLFAHEKIHSGEKPHLCASCNVSFAQKSDFNKHLNSQTHKNNCLEQEVEQGALEPLKQEASNAEQRLVAKALLASHLSKLKSKDFLSLRDALKVIRGPNNKMDDCTELSRKVLLYLQTGIIEGAEIEAPQNNYPAIVQWDIKPVKQEGRQKKVSQIFVAGFSLNNKYNISENLPSYKDIRYEIDLTYDDEIVCIVPQVLEEKPLITDNILYIKSANINSDGELERKLKKQARANKTGISFGFITLGRAGTKGVTMAGHMLNYFATESAVIYFDAQLINGITGEGDPIVHSLKDAYTFVNNSETLTPDTFGQYVFYAPLNS